MNMINLKELISPITEAEFFKSHWPEKPLFIPSLAGKLEQIFNLPQFKDLESLVSARTLKVRACLPDYDDEYSSIHVEQQDALKVYANNMTLVFDQMQKQSDIIALALKNITADLGLVFGSLENNLCQARSIAYATPQWCGTRLHFDANANFIIQIHGTKKWTLAKNNSVNFPTERFTTGSLEMSMALEKQCHAELLDSVPDDATEYLMQPGCVLFVPRGYWHETTTDDDSLSLNFTFSQPTWADIFSKSIHGLLQNSPEWRRLAIGLGGLAGREDQKQATEQFQIMIQKIISDLSGISAKSLLAQGGFVPPNEEELLD